MKKIIALVLALTMLMGITSVLAATDSKEDLRKTIIFVGEGIIEVVWEPEITGEDAPIEEIVDDIVKKAQNADADVSPLDRLPEDVRSQLPEGYAIVNELELVRLEGDVTAVDEFKAGFKFNTPYEAGSTVYVAVCAADEESEEWTLLEGAVDEDSNVVLTFGSELLAKLGNKPFLMMVISDR